LTTMHLTAYALTASTGRRVVTLEALEVGYRVRALKQMGLSSDAARTFGYGDGELSKVKLLATRRHLITEAS